ncbi:alpha/beta hydrolase-fold protein [Vibrio olivae]|uniref:Alpha/beta hydrolase-fold protein n=1 Tax=Vibrio olivae TaxID=1243002 RepID=A0ABV5HR38_9VIBR
MKWFYGILGSILISYSLAAQAKTLLDKQYRDALHPSASFQVQKNHYYQLSFSAVEPLSSATLSHDSVTLASSLLTTGGLFGERFWTANNNDTLTIKFNSDSENHITLQVDEFELKDDQRVNPKQVIQSPLLRQVQTDSNASTSYDESWFWQQVGAQGGTPLVEPIDNDQVLMTFLWRGDDKNVRLLGAPYEGHAYLSKLENSTIWYQSYKVPNDTRLSYYLAPNSPQLKPAAGSRQAQRRAVLSRIQADPLNHGPLFASRGQSQPKASTLDLSHQDDTTADVHQQPKGQIQRFVFDSEILGNQHVIDLYTPNQAYPVNQYAPLVIAFDGLEYQQQIPTPTILDTLIDEGKIPPTRALFIHNLTPKSRAIELPANPDFAKMLAKELLPWLCQQKVCPSAENTLLLGSSFGGLAASYAALAYPTQFGKVLSLSGSYWWSAERFPNGFTDLIQPQFTHSVQFYLTAGRLETAPESDSILTTNRQFYHQLNTLGYSATLNEVAGGHDYFSWRSAIADGLIWLLSTDSQKNKL